MRGCLEYVSRAFEIFEENNFHNSRIQKKILFLTIDRASNSKIRDTHGSVFSVVDTAGNEIRKTSKCEMCF